MGAIPWWLLLLILSNLVLWPFFALILTATLGALAARPRRSEGDGPEARFLVVIPAHDEAAGIAATIRSCQAFHYPADRFEVLVIADNCSDETAAIARREGATVLERFDSLRKSKGYAIEDMIEWLRKTGQFGQFDAIVIIDADSLADPGLLRCFARVLRDGHDWIQCLYTVSNPDASWRTRLLTYAFSLFNGVFPLGLSQVGLSASFRGNGMCFSRAGLERVPWQSRGLVEDLEFSWVVRTAGERIAFVADAGVSGEMVVRGGAAAAAQRKRWEFGRRELRRKFLWPLLRSQRLGGLQKLAALLELVFPSMVTLVVSYLVVGCINLIAIGSVPSILSFPGRVFLLASTLFMTLTLGLYAVSPFFVLRLPWVYALSLGYFPIYAGWKFAVALGEKPVHWVRTARNSADR